MLLTCAVCEARAYLPVSRSADFLLRSPKDARAPQWNCLNPNDGSETTVLDPKGLHVCSNVACADVVSAQIQAREDHMRERRSREDTIRREAEDRLRSVMDAWDKQNPAPPMTLRGCGAFKRAPDEDDDPHVGESWLTR